MSTRERTSVPPTRRLAEAARAALGDARRAHVEAVVATVEAIARDGGWQAPVVEAAVRAAWIHDVRREADPEALAAEIAAAGETPDPWALAHAPILLHAQAAAAWAIERGVDDPGTLAAVRHHPTAHAAWGPVGKLLYVADFAEPGRAFADAVDAAGIQAEAARGAAGLDVAAVRVLGLRLAHEIDRRRPVHPESWRAWNAWTGAGGS